MIEAITRRETLRRGVAATSLLALIPEWATPALAQGETDIPFTDIPKTFNPGNPNSPTRMLDIRKIDGPLTPKDQFFTMQHFSRPDVDPVAYRLKFTGMVNKPTDFTLADLRAMKSTELICGFECSGNSARSVQGLSSCARFTGVRLATVLKQLGVHPKAREVVFFGADHGPQDVVFRQQTFKLDQQFGRSITLENAMKPEPLLAYALNGDPLTPEQGFPVRLIMPGWYGVANVKWVSEVHLQEDRYLGNYQARWYRSVLGVGGTGEDNDPNTQWVETEVTRMHLKSVIARVRKRRCASDSRVRAERRDAAEIGGGPDRRRPVAEGDRRSLEHEVFMEAVHLPMGRRYPGEHTLDSRATDANGEVQPTAAGLSRKKTFLEDNGQFPRKVMIA